MTGRRALFIDGANLDRTARSLGFGIDYKRLLLKFEKSGVIVHSHFYLAIKEGEVGGVQSLTDWLKVNRFIVRTKPMKRHEDEGRSSRSRIGVDLAVDVLEMAPRVDEGFFSPATAIFAPSSKRFNVWGSGSRSCRVYRPHRRWHPKN